MNITPISVQNYNCNKQNKNTLAFNGVYGIEHFTLYCKKGALVNLKISDEQIHGIKETIDKFKESKDFDLCFNPYSNGQVFAYISCFCNNKLLAKILNFLHRDYECNETDRIPGTPYYITHINKKIDISHSDHRGYIPGRGLYRPNELPGLYDLLIKGWDMKQQQLIAEETNLATKRVAEERAEKEKQAKIDEQLKRLGLS